MIVLELKMKDGTPVNLDGVQCDIFYSHKGVSMPMAMPWKIHNGNIISIDDSTIGFDESRIKVGL
ncbi:MAG TPA: hypothetical protein EYN51_08530 [Flavobacteriales bacterium]|nr:hypothetical protein [Flavobacteriales bacterium]